MTQTTIHGGTQFTRHVGSALGDIRHELQSGAVYTKLTIRGGAQSCEVIGTRKGQAPESIQVLAEHASPTSAVINGGYFVHKKALKIDGKVNGAEAADGDLGRPVGPTSTRDDHVPVARLWANDFGQLQSAAGEVALTSGPTLAVNGHPFHLAKADRFEYRIDGKENPLNVLAGALTHASDANERAAISVLRDQANAPTDVIFHALTASGARHLGVTMQEWQAITTVGADPAGTRGGATESNRASTLNLDGGGSVFLGLRGNHGVTQIARGGNPAEELRPVANVIAVKAATD